ncbi:MAG TPA: hypothetical protein VLR94_07085 [Acidobacteriota bacterium]|nr:hypothetical protein [Acidobacteriota bacterium]
MQVAETLPKAAEEGHSATVYFNPAEGADAPEILLFEEKSVSPGTWRAKASRKGKQYWERIRERYEHLAFDLFATDHFLHRLNHFQKITVLLNKPIDPALVRERLHQIFRDRSYHHLRWLIIDAILLPLSLLLAPMPGPNIPGYYLLFRVVMHLRSYRSASHAELEEIDVQVSDHAEEVNTLLRKGNNVRAALQDLRKKYGLRALQEHKFIPQLSVFKEGWARFKHGIHHEDAR